MTTANPQVILYAQHGWADDRSKVAALATSVAEPGTLVIAPSLGYIKTWLRIEPLIQAVEQLVIETDRQHPNVPIRVVGHSMGGLIWLEVLNRHPEWWSRIESIVLVASPVGGADLARALDPFNWGIGIARDLGVNRHRLAEAIAAKIPMLVVAGDIDGGSDGTITVESTKVFGAEFVCLPGLPHPILANHPKVAAAIRQFWQLVPDRPLAPRQTVDISYKIIQRLQSVPGMTDAHYRDFPHAKVYLTFDNGMTIRTWTNPMGVDHVFVACPQGSCLYSGFVGWLHTNDLRQSLQEMQSEYQPLLVITRQ
ncbi:alpha/beta hydrolase [Pantanalinema sp. GBBB05]|uniref:alpha/beta hydrolase n=1 Tax=Pantanalinema sp. GBBB05 TaxID=2604139 RepID=UPI003D816BE3